jgi:hypothetical protein
MMIEALEASATLALVEETVYLAIIVAPSDVRV